MPKVQPGACSISTRADVNRANVRRSNRIARAARTLGHKWLANKVTKLAATLTSCDDHGCGSGACNACNIERIAALATVVATMRRKSHRPLAIASIIPDLQLPVSFYSKASLAGAVQALGDERQRLKCNLAVAGITQAVGAIDFSVNVHRDRAWLPYLQPHYWIFAPFDELEHGRAQLAAAYPRSQLVHCPVRVKEWNGNERAIRYALKSEFQCRVTLPAERLDDGTTLKRGNTRLRKLTVARHCALLILLNAMGEFHRFVIRGATLPLDRGG